MRRFAFVVVTIAVALAAVPVPAQAAPCAGFTDVEDTSGFCTSVAWMRNRGITLGCTATLYCPSDYVRRDQMAAFMYRLGVQNAFLTGGNAFGAAAVLGTTDNQPLDIRVSGGRVMRFEPTPVSPNVVGGHASNSAITLGEGATIAGGGQSGADCYEPSTATSTRSCANRVWDYGAVGGGYSNAATGFASAVPGGASNTASGSLSGVAGGANNIAAGYSSAVAGGNGNIASGSFSIVAGGLENTASGYYSFAAGRRAIASGDGSFALSDTSSGVFFPVSATNAFGARFTGGFTFASSVDPATGNMATGCQLFGGTGAWSCTSDRDTKVAVSAVDPQAILQRLSTLPVSQWRFTGEPERVRHLGPMAQDFHATFGLGHDDRSISVLDAHGVALAAIQGLNAKLEEREAVLRAEAAAKDAEIALLRSQAHALRREVADLRAAQRKELTGLRRAVAALMARTSGEGRVASSWPRDPDRAGPAPRAVAAASAP